MFTWIEDSGGNFPLPPQGLLAKLHNSL